MAKKAPRRTAERILETALGMFNRFGEPNVPTTSIAAQLGISPGNLYYHYPAKDELILRLYRAYRAELNELLHATADVVDVEDAWFFMHSLFELIWRYRFLYRDLNDLLSKNRQLEQDFQEVLRAKVVGIETMLAAMQRAGNAAVDAGAQAPLAHSMVVVLTYWLSYEYVQNPRQALESAHAQAAMLRGGQHTLHLLAPYLAPMQRASLLSLGEVYLDDGEAPSRSPVDTRERASV